MLAINHFAFDFSFCFHFDFSYVISFLVGILAGAIFKLVWGASFTGCARSPRPKGRRPTTRRLSALPASLMVLSLVMLSNHSASMLCAGAKLRHLSILPKQRLVYPHMPSHRLGHRGDLSLRNRCVDKAYRMLESLRVPDWTSLTVAGYAIPICADLSAFPLPKPDRRIEVTEFMLVSDSDQDLVSHDGVHIIDDEFYNTAYLSEAQATSLRTLLSHLHSTGTLNRPSLVIDCGASISITDDISDFISPPSPINCPSHIDGIGKGLSVAGRGRVEWKVVDKNGVMGSLITESFYCPQSPVKLFSPQSYLEFQATEGEGKLVLTRSGGELQTPGGLVLHFGYHPLRKLPILRLVPKNMSEELDPEANLCVSAENNRNLTQKQRDALLWHWKLGHCALRTVGKLSTDGIIKKGLGPACKDLLCEACRLACAKKCHVGHRDDV